MMDGQPWLVAADVCRAIGLDQVSRAVSRLKDAQKGVTEITTPGGKQKVTVVNEPGVYRLIGRSNKPEAERFQDWVYEKVLPTIRKTGRYDANLARYKAEELAVIEADPRVHTMRRLLELTEEQTVQQFRLESVEREQAVLRQDMELVDRKAVAALTTANAVDASYHNRTGYRSCLAHSRHLDLNLNRGQLSAISRKVGARCQELGWIAETVDDERFGTIKTYPTAVLEEFDDLFRSYAKPKFARTPKQPRSKVGAW